MLSINIFFVLTFLVSAIITRLSIGLGNKFPKIFRDNNWRGPQKIHNVSVTRIGGVGIFFSFCIVGNIFERFSSDAINLDSMLPAIVTSYLIFFIGFAEDITGRLSVKFRLILIIVTLLLSCYLLNIHIDRTGIEFLDYILENKTCSILFTTFAITGLINSYNIIDGVNGLSSFASLASLLSLFYVALQFQEPEISYLILLSIASNLGFLLYNFPRGLIFMGDCGAYLLGFWISFYSITLINNVESLSPFFIILINIYPITETLFSIYRRMKRGLSPGSPDVIHLHSLIFRRLAGGSKKNKSVILNSASSIYMWPYITLSNIMGIIFCQNSYYLICQIIIFIIIYLSVYRMLIKFQAPNFLKIKN